MIVKSCNECPLFRDTPVLGGILKLLGNDVNSGYCAYDREAKGLLVFKLGLPPGAERDAHMARFKAKMIVENSREIPAECPLRDGELTVTLGS